MLTLAASLAYRMWGQQLLTYAMVPRSQFRPMKPLASDAYASGRMWIARPDMGAKDPTLWLPEGYRADKADKSTADAGQAAIFFIHPTSYFDRQHWNAENPARDGAERAKLFVQSQASVFAPAGKVWAPRYRQATFGAFLGDSADATRALDAAYADVTQAFAWFLHANPDGPIILAGHSQGTLHLLRLLKDAAGSEAIRRRIVAVYAVGWPVSVSADLPALGLPACTARAQAGCILSWQSFAEPAETDSIEKIFDAETGFAGTPRKGTQMLCTNPLTGTPNSAAAASLNLGTLRPDASLTKATLVPAAVPARCDKRGFLMIGDPPDLGPYVLPGNNYHVYDYALFWANLRRDATERLATFLKQR